MRLQSLSTEGKFWINLFLLLIPLVAIYLRALFTFCLSFINAGINDFGSCITSCSHSKPSLIPSCDVATDGNTFQGREESNLFRCRASAIISGLFAPSTSLLLQKTRRGLFCSVSCSKNQSNSCFASHSLLNGSLLSITNIIAFADSKKNFQRTLILSEPPISQEIISRLDSGSTTFSIQKPMVGISHTTS